MARCQRRCVSSPHPYLLHDTMYTPAYTCNDCSSPSSHPGHFEEITSICLRRRIRRRGEDSDFFAEETHSLAIVVSKGRMASPSYFHRPYPAISSLIGVHPTPDI
ncbi:hypothetical protein ARMSODRAFT_737630 [Armillaria solidipes]|uniref:Uncharacterized protein n=1 Tax=Armillaria solidipes TaxID=1076256 RepID=A0A2H3AMN8_9AGAR|nr:hypothetical protein ARMSODRAFT_737630 [Armillaria solidipes]